MPRWSESEPWMIGTAQLMQGRQTGVPGPPDSDRVIRTSRPQTTQGLGGGKLMKGGVLDRAAGDGKLKLEIEAESKSEG